MLAVAAPAPTIQAIRPVAPVVQASVPVQLRIPSIGVDTALQDLGLQPDGSLEVPSQWEMAGWFRGGVRPGDAGPAVIAGHVDSRSGPAVFYRLRELHAGDAVLVTRADRSVVRFVVDDVARYRKDTFPAATVYGPQPVPMLRLITCTGDFDWSTHNYLDNLVVSAHRA
jgi:Sortase domain